MNNDPKINPWAPTEAAPTDPWNGTKVPPNWGGPARPPQPVRQAPQAYGSAPPAPTPPPTGQPQTPNQASRFGTGAPANPHAANANRWQTPPEGGWASKDYSTGTSQTACETPDESWSPGSSSAPPQSWGQPHQIHVQPSGRGALFGAFASFCIPGLGQLLLGQEEKGMVIMGVWLFTVFGFFGIFHILAPIDAYLIGRKMQRGAPVRPYEFF